MRWPAHSNVLAAVILLLAGADAHAAPITVQGEDAARANIPTATAPDASGGAYLALDTVEPAPSGGWYAKYRVRVPARGVYRLDAVATSPAVPDRRPFGGSQFNLSINGAPFAQVAKSEPYWAGFCAQPPEEPPPTGVCTDWGESAPAWGSTIHARLDDVELRAGANTVAFMVDERRTSASPQLDDPAGPPTRAAYRFLLDEFTLTPTPVALKSVSLGDPATNLGTYRDGPADLTFGLNGRAATALTVTYRVVDYFGHEVAAGAAAVAAGGRKATAELPDLPPGNFRVVASLASAPDVQVVGHFARLRAQEPVDASVSRFGVTTSSPWLIPSSRLDAFADAVKEMGAGYVREEISWPLAQPGPGSYDTTAPNRAARTFRRHGLNVLGAWWNIAGSATAEAPSWAMSETSVPLPDDLRDGYRFARHVGAQGDGIGRDALELWNEPDLDDTSSTGDQHAAYFKAAALGVADASDAALISLPGVGAWPGVFQDLMLQNEVVRYADVWAHHVYAFPYKPGELTPFPLEEQAGHQHELTRLYDPTIPQVWATESGVFAIPPTSGHDLSSAQQVDQARYLVQSAVGDLAAGTDRHFWFSGPPYCANGFGGFGLFSGDFQPWPSYSAHAAMASILGKANFAHEVGGMPENARGYVFRNGSQAVTVVWADSATPVHVPVPGGDVSLYDIMGAPRGSLPVEDAAVSTTASLDPIYIVSNGGTTLDARPTADDKRDRRAGTPSTAERIVLSQRYAAGNAAPGKEDGDAEPPLGYRLDASTKMAVDVYNFNDAPQAVTVTGHAWHGWSVSGPRTVVVPANGRVKAPFTIVAGTPVRRRVDYPLVFEATVGGRAVPASVARIQRRDGTAGEPLPLTPAITGVSPDAGSTVGPNVQLRARIADPVSGVDPGRVVVEVDGRPVARQFNAATGRLSASLHLTPGDHEIWIRAYNNALAPAQAIVELTVPQ